VPQETLWLQPSSDTYALVDALVERAETDAKAREWTTTHELLARLLELLSVLRIENLACHGVRSGLPKPARMPRPGETTGPVVLRPGEAARLMMAN
jgi:hypothetical protein